jgi:type I restriction enzyme R subunit
MPEQLDKRSLSERDICTKYITPGIVGAGWDIQTQIREEVTFSLRRGESTQKANW